MKSLAGAYKANDEELVQRILEQQENLKSVQKKLDAAKTELAMMKIPELVSLATEGKLVHLVEVDDADQLRQITAKVGEALGSKSIAVLLAEVQGRPLVSAAVGREAQGEVRAGDLVKSAATVLGGGGGGKADFAQGGGSDSSKLEEAIKELKRQIH
jgi:alanyl-tRNA synthetase